MRRGRRVDDCLRKGRGGGEQVGEARAVGFGERRVRMFEEEEPRDRHAAECGELAAASRNGGEDAPHVPADPVERVRPGEQPETVEFGQDCAVARDEMRGADEGRRNRQLALPDEQDELLAGEIAVHAARQQRARGDLEAGFLLEFAGGGGFGRFAWLDQALRNVPARRASGVTEEQAWPVGHDYAGAGHAHG